MNNLKIYVFTNEDFVMVTKIKLPTGEIIRNLNGTIDFTVLQSHVNQKFTLINNSVEEENVLLFVGKDDNGNDVIEFDSLDNLNKNCEVIDDIPEDHIIIK